MRTLGQRYAQRSKPKLEKAWDAQGILLRFQFLELEDLALRVIFAPGAAVRLRDLPPAVRPLEQRRTSGGNGGVDGSNTGPLGISARGGCR